MRSTGDEGVGRGLETTKAADFESEAEKNAKYKATSTFREATGAEVS